MQPETDTQHDRPKTGIDPEANLNDAHHAIEYVGQWIRSADTKAGLLTASVAVIIGAGSSQFAIFSAALESSSSAMGIVLALIVFTVGVIAVAIVALGSVVTPRTRPTDTPSRFSFRTLASPAWTRSSVTRSQASEEAWAQAIVLAKIARDKHRALRVASIASFSAVFTYATALITALLIN